VVIIAYDSAILLGVISVSVIYLAIAIYFGNKEMENVEGLEYGAAAYKVFFTAIGYLCFFASILILLIVPTMSRTIVQAEHAGGMNVTHVDNLVGNLEVVVQGQMYFTIVILVLFFLYFLWVVLNAFDIRFW